MTVTTTQPASPTVGPLLAAMSGAALFTTFFVAAGAQQSGGDAYGVGEWAVTVALLLAAIAGAVFAARVAQRRDAASVALVLAVIAAVTFVAFWSGVMHVLAAEAAYLALVAQRRHGGWTARSAAALALASITLVAGIVLVVVG